MTNTLELIWCRTFQAVLKVGNYFMGYRMPHSLEGPGKLAPLTPLPTMWKPATKPLKKTDARPL